MSKSNNHFKNAKKAQLTVFIILGIFLLIAAATIIYYYGIKIEEQEITAVEGLNVPLWAQPIKNYVDNCIKSKSVEAFKKIGEHGGYINPEDSQLSPSFQLNKEDPTNSDAVYLSENNHVIYWWHMKSNNLCQECVVSSLLPSIDAIQRQVNLYINRELEKCVEDFKSFKDTGFVITKGGIETTTIVNRDDVTVNVKYPLFIKLGQSEFKMSDFKINLDLDFQHVYDIAALTTVEEINNLTLEDITLNLLGVYAGADFEKIPPISWIDNKKSFVTWSKDIVEERLKADIFSPNINIIQVNKTKDAKQIEGLNPITTGFYKTLYLNYLPYNYLNFTVNFFYDPSWKIFFDITPRSGNMLEPRVVRQNFPLNFAPPEQTNYYEFYYDLSFPIIVIIKDESSLLQEGENGYTFMFALESNIRDNKDLYEWNKGRGTIGYYEPNSVTVTYRSTENSFGICTGSGNFWHCPLNGRVYTDNITCNVGCISTSTNVTQPRFVESLMCNPSQRIGTEVILNVIDDTQNAFEEVLISYKCGNYRSCAVGSTDGGGKFVGTLPVCIGQGILKLEKDEVIPKSIKMESIFGETKTVNIVLDKVVEKDIKILTSDFNALATDQFRQSAKPLLGNEQVTLTASRLKQADEEDSITTSIVMSQGDTKQTIRLAPGMYEVRALLQNLDGAVIPTDINGAVPVQAIPSVTIKPVIVGGVELINETGYWIVNKGDIDNSKLVTFYLYKVFNPTTFEDVARGGDLTNISKAYRALFEPEFS